MRGMLLGRNERVGFLDEIRGLSLVLMVLYHGAYDIVYIFRVDIPAFHWPIFNFLQPFFAGVFILVSGVCCRYSRSNIKRGVLALAVGLAMTLFTWLFLPEQAILFGILHLLGFSMIVFGLLRPLLDKLPSMVGILLSLLLFACTWGVRGGSIGIGPLSLHLPAAPYRLGYLFALGFPAAGFHSADYFPVLPWLFLFLAGTYLGVLFVGGDMPRALYRTRSRALAAVGRRSLLIYILHQPVLYGLLMLVFRIVQIWR